MNRSARTRLFALLGDPVRHSLSPRLQNAAFQAAGIDAVYVALRCDKATLPGLMRGIARAGGGGNVTIPHKYAAAAVLDDATPAVAATGACNTFWFEHGGIRGDNTDVAGFARAARTLVPTLAGMTVLLLGAGGGAAAAVRALLDHRAARVTVSARSRDRATALAARQDPDGGIVAVASAGESFDDASFDLVINATPLGLQPDDPLPFPLERLGSIGSVFDMAYRPGGTEWVRHAAALGLPACDGTRMLVEQGAAAFFDWFGVEPSRAVIRDALQAG